MNYTITHNLTNLTKGNITLTIQAEVGYQLPSSISVSNGTLVSYDSTTGVAVINGDDTTIVNVVCEAQPSVDPVLANNDWATIKSVCESGEAGNYWAVGDTKTDTGIDTKTRTMRICDMQGLYSKHVVFEQVEQESTTYVWNNSSNVDDNSAYNNYNIADIRTSLNTTIKALYSNDLSSNLTLTSVKVAKNGNNGTLLDVTDYLFLPAEKEIFGSATYSRSEEAAALTQYQYYASHNTANDRKKLRDGTAKAWWLRSPNSGDANYVCYVSAGGIANSYYAYDTLGVAPCFAF